MLILHILAPAEVGGLEHVVHLLAQGQARSGEEVHVAAVLDGAGAADQLLHSLGAGGVTTHPIVLSGRAYWRERAAILALCRRLRPDVVHTHGYRPDVVDAPVARRLGIPTVTTVHGFTGGDWKNRLYERMQRRAHRKFDAVVVVSRPLMVQLIQDGVPPHRLHLVQNAWQGITPPLERLAARRALGIPARAFHVGWVGRLSVEKGPDVLLDAIGHLGDLPIVVSVLGTGRERGVLLDRARALGLAERIHWHGVVPGAARLFSAFDVFVLSSRTEGTPVVLFEAMAAGVPIVATGVGGVPDVMSSTEGVLVPPDDPVALAAEILGVYERPAAAQQRARAARTRLERDFSGGPWLDRYAGIYRQVSQGVPAPVAT